MLLSYFFPSQTSLLILQFSQMAWLGFFIYNCPNSYAATGNQTHIRRVAPNSRDLVIAPMFWTSIPLPVRRSMSHTYKLMKLAPLSGIRFTDFMKVKAGADGTHLTRNSASHYIKQVQDLFGQIGESTGIGPVVFLEPEPPAQGATAAATSAAPTDWSEEVSMEDEDAVHLLEAPEEEDGPAPTRTARMLSASILLPPSRQVTTLIPGIATVGGMSMGETQARLMRLAAPAQAPAPDFTIPPPRPWLECRPRLRPSIMPCRRPTMGYHPCH